MSKRLQNTGFAVAASALLAAVASAEPDVVDGFDAEKINAAHWEPSFKSGDAQFTPNGEALQYKVDGEPAKTFRYLYLRSERFYSGKDWSVEVDARNDILPLRTGQLGSIGLEVYDANNLSRRLSVALSVSRISGAYSRVAYTQVVDDGETLASTYSESLPDTARLKLAWDSGEKVLSVSYKNPEIDGADDPWQKLASYGIDGGKGELEDVVWRMGRRGQFLIYLYAYTEQVEAAAGEMTLDNFSATLE